MESLTGRSPVRLDWCAHRVPTNRPTSRGDGRDPHRRVLVCRGAHRGRPRLPRGAAGRGPGDGRRGLARGRRRPRAARDGDGGRDLRSRAREPHAARRADGGGRAGATRSGAHERARGGGARRAQHVRGARGGRARLLRAGGAVPGVCPRAGLDPRRAAARARVARGAGPDRATAARPRKTSASSWRVSRTPCELLAWPIARRCSSWRRWPQRRRPRIRRHAHRPARCADPVTRRTGLRRGARLGLAGGAGHRARGRRAHAGRARGGAYGRRRRGRRRARRASARRAPRRVDLAGRGAREAGRPARGLAASAARTRVAARRWRLGPGSSPRVSLRGGGSAGPGRAG